MNLNKANNDPIDKKIKKLKISSIQKNFFSNSQKNIFTKNKTPTLKKIPFLLKETSQNNNNNKSKNPFNKKLLSIIKGKKSLKNISNIYKYIFEEPNEKEIKKDKNMKSNIEMRKRFYIRSREGLKKESESESVLNIYNDSPSSKYLYNINNKTLSKNKNRIYEEDTSMNEYDLIKNKFNRNSSEVSPLNKKKKKSNSFIMPRLNSISTKNKRQDPLIQEYNYYNESKKPSLYLNNKKIIKQKKEEISKIIERSNKTSELFKKIFKKSAKKHAKIFSKSLFDIQYDNDPYETVNKNNSKGNLVGEIYFNNHNLDRLIKVEKTNKKGFNDEDIINNIYKIKDYNQNAETILKRLKKTNAFPRSIKINNFSHSTIIKYKNLHRSNFGLPN